MSPLRSGSTPDAGIDQVILLGMGVSRRQRINGDYEHDLMRFDSNSGLLPVSQRFNIRPPWNVDVVYKKLCGRCCMPVMYPNSTYSFTWLMFGVLCVVYESFAVPLQLAFEMNFDGVLFAIASVINAYFMLDLMVTFSTGYVTPEGVMVMDPCLIAKRYLRGWFWVDLIISIPWEWVEYSGGMQLTRGGKTLRYLRPLRMLKLTRLLRNAKLTTALEQFQLHLESNHVFVFTISVVRSLISLFYAMHWSACAWYAVGSQDIPETTWIEHLQETKSVGQGSLSLMQRYFWSLYFTMTTMTTTGYGDISPQNDDECRFTLVLLPVATVIFATLMGVLLDLISNLNHQSRLRNEKKMLLARYMSWRIVPWELMMRLRRHMLFIWDTKADFDNYEEELKAQLPANLKAELCYHVYGRILERAPFLYWMLEYTVCVKQLCCLVSEVHLEANDCLFRVGQPNEHIYILLTGTICLHFKRNFDEHNLREYEHSLRARTFPQLKHRQSTSVEFFNLSQKPNDVVDEIRHVVSRVRTRRSLKEPPMQAQPTLCQTDTMSRAADLFHERNTTRTRAVALLQRFWRRRHTDRLRHRAAARSRDTSFGSERSGLQASGKHQIVAPSYFGEACLWTPFKEWGITPAAPCGYSANCVQRADLVHIPRSAVQSIVERYGPWLETRLFSFAEAVQMATAEGTERAWPVPPEGAQFASPGGLRRSPDEFGEPGASMTSTLSSPIRSAMEVSVRLEPRLVKRRL